MKTIEKRRLLCFIYTMQIFTWRRNSALTRRSTYTGIHPITSIVLSSIHLYSMDFSYPLPFHESPQKKSKGLRGKYVWQNISVTFVTASHLRKQTVPEVCMNQQRTRQWSSDCAEECYNLPKAFGNCTRDHFTYLVSNKCGNKMKTPTSSCSSLTSCSFLQQNSNRLLSSHSFNSWSFPKLVPKV